MYTTSSAFLDALIEHGVSYIFANLGSDHPALVEAIAEARAAGRRIPDVVTCPNEMVGMSAAHGFWQASGVAQAVVVHVECGTQALAGAVHNAAKGHAPMLIFAGASPFTQHGEMKGSRNEFIQWIQDVHDQRGLVRSYMRYDNELRTGKNVKELVHRALQFANSDPKGPTYLMGAREVMEEEVTPTPDDAARWKAIEPAALGMTSLDAIGSALLSAKRPLIVTSFVGRNPAAVAPLVRLAEKLGIGVLESVPNAMNFPHDHPLYLGNQWNQPRQNQDLAAADVVLVIDSDVPWIPTVSKPAEDARIFHIDVDPLKEQMPLWRINAEAVCRADAATALEQLLRWLDGKMVDAAQVAERQQHYAHRHAERDAELGALEAMPSGTITPEYFVSRLRAAQDDQMLFVNEAISNYHTVFNHLGLNMPGQIFTSGGGSLGYNGGAAIGVKLARPDATVVALTGDGSFMFTVPSSVHWMARRYEAPFLQVIFNNRGWKSPKLSTLAVHPDGFAAHANGLDTSFDPAPDYVGIAKASGNAWGRQIVDPAQVDEAIAEALRVVREQKRCAVLDVWLDHH
ncbi:MULTISPECIES: thiamine pyrophosphate-requiring protein [unclassified Novosphingobium]|uniref:thiamine pyrophosphate-requiring protein n=1 Tax=unclassified Novosphingobium TaxID=2644732 RepID=UPI0014476478|nr:MULTISPECIES: thiamine pyrophosphate-requiring protein [unclassified Novosphingobium]NKJ45061.1 acetolactate synthase-1/2/3 large subunit [Novosphingobium sp. SG720]NMN07632.1 acetolactate synthase-1/2/3 large subunit [Novosphingobium sp. SG919]NMN89942.1 acetolactate synthase-1/2/3 large subunit [Novosphingobium sp. SG916]